MRPTIYIAADVAAHPLLTADDREQVDARWRYRVLWCADPARHDGLGRPVSTLVERAAAHALARDQEALGTVVLVGSSVDRPRDWLRRLFPAADVRIGPVNADFHSGAAINRAIEHALSQELAQEDEPW